MKNRRTVILAFLLIAVMAIGIGYAAVVDVLDITGTAQISTSTLFESNIYFSNAEAVTEGNTARVNDDNNDKCSFTASSMLKEGDTATFRFTVKNDNNKAATVSCKANHNTDATHFAIAMKWVGADDAYATDATALTVPANDSAVIEITVTLVNLPADYTTGEVLSATFTNELNVDDGSVAAG